MIQKPGFEEEAGLEDSSKPGFFCKAGFLLELFLKNRLTSVEYKFYNGYVESLLKLAALSENMEVEVEDEAASTSTCLLSQASCSAAPAKSDHSSLPITTVAMPNGQRMPILKTVLTSVCEKNCYYCAFRAGRESIQTVRFAYMMHSCVNY